MFEHEVAEYTGAPHCVAVDSATNALFLSFLWMKRRDPQLTHLVLPAHTYVGVQQAARNAGYGVMLERVEWESEYQAGFVWDAAKRFERGMYRPGTLTCVSFQASKKVPIGRGGAILLDDPEADRWLRRARLDGRGEGVPYEQATFTTPGFHCYMSPPDAARGLWLMTYLEDEDTASWRDYPDLSEASWS